MELGDYSPIAYDGEVGCLEEKTSKTKMVETFTVLVQQMDGKTILVEMDSKNNSIGVLKCRVELLEGYPSLLQQLFVLPTSEEILHGDACPLEDEARVRPGSILALCVLPTGGSVSI